MRLILETSINCRRRNLLISNEVAVIILDEYNDAGFYNIISIERCITNKPLRYCCISLVRAVYMPLYYILLFPRGNTGWYWGF